MKRRMIWMVALLAVEVLLVCSQGEMASASPAVKPDFSRSEWIWQVEDTLYRSLRDNPKAPAVRSEALRTIHDIGYYLQRAREAARAGDPEMMEIQARQAVSLLQRSVHRGYFPAGEINSILEAITRYLPNARA